MKRGKKICLIFISEAIALLFCVAMLLVYLKTDQKVDISIADWKSDYIEYDDSYGWYANREIVPVEETTNLLYGPSILLKKGFYTIKIEYESDYAHSCTVYGGEDNVYLEAGTVILSEKQNKVSYDFKAKDDIKEFQFLVTYDGLGIFEITSIVIEHSSAGIRQSLLILLASFAVLDLFLFFGPWIRERKNTILALAGIVFLTTLPLMTENIGNGHDLGFHLMRIEGIAREIRYGNFPVQLSSIWLDNFGYPVSIFYGDILLYIPAALRLFGFPVVTSYKIFIFLVCTGTTGITYWCMKEIFHDKRTAVFTCLAYNTASYRLVNIYVRSAVGEYCAMMFFPIVALATYRIYTDDSSDWKKYKNNALILAVGMSGLIGTHILSTEMTVVILICVCLILMKKTFRKNTIKVYSISIVWTCLLSAYFIVPFLDYYYHVPVRINTPENDYHIQGSGAYISEYFSFFRDIFSTGSIHGNRRLLYTPGPILMGALVIALVCLICRCGSRVIGILTVCSVFSLYLASNQFPWNYIADHFAGGRLLAQVQFPTRYISISIVLLTLLLGTLYKDLILKTSYQRQCEQSVIVFCVVMSCLFVSNYNDDTDFYYAYGRAEVHTDKVGSGEYIRYGTDLRDIITDLYWENIQDLSMVERRGSYMKLYCEEAGDDNIICLPMFNYKGYHAMDKLGNEYIVVDSPNNQIQFSVPAGYTGEIVVAFKEPWYWRAAELLSLISLIFALYLWIKRYVIRIKNVTIQGLI